MSVDINISLNDASEYGDPDEDGIRVTRPGATASLVITADTYEELEPYVQAVRAQCKRPGR